MEVQPPQPQHPEQQEHQPQPDAHHVDIPALAPPQQQMQMAPTIIQGAPLDQNNIELARTDVELMKTMHSKGQATQEQISAARQRYFNVRQYSPPMANVGVGLAAAIQNLQNTVNQRFNNVQNTMNQRFNNVDQRLNAIDRRFDSMDARFENVGRRATNLSIRTQRGANTQLMPLVKERPGLGAVLPGNFEPIVIDDPPVQVGDPVQHFPANFDEISNLSHAEINFLSQMYNNNFRIVGADTIGVRRKKFEDFIMLG